MKRVRVAVVGLLVWGSFESTAPTGHTQDLPRPRRAGRCVVNIAGILNNAVKAACIEVGSEQCAPLSVHSSDLGSGLTHYEIDIQVGPHSYDRVVLHRVVSEHWSGLPRYGIHGVMLMQSHAFSFERFFLPSLCTARGPEVVCAGATLADRGIDVWGLDLRMHSVPETVDDFGFMEGWGLETHMADIRLAMTAAQFARAATVRWPDPKLHLLGFGRSVWLAYGLANYESQLPASSRSITGLIIVDQPFQYEPGDSWIRQLDCDDEEWLRASVARGDFEISRAGLRADGEAALSNPDGPSRHDASVTNREYALYVGAATYLDFAPVPHYHITAGELDDEGVPIRLIYTEEQHWFETMAAAVPHESVPYFLDTMAIACGESEVPFDDHLSEITVPVLYIGAAGGYGGLGIYATALLGSEDVTSLIVQHQTAENAVMDFGHGDIWFSAAAKTEVWEPLADWLEAH